MRTYLINMDGSDDRLAQAKRCLSQEGIQFERVSATDGRGLTPEIMDRFYRPDRSLLQYGRKLGAGEIGCYLSHLDCLQRFIASDHKFALVIEDDITAPSGCGHVLKAVIADLDTRESHLIAVVNLANRARKICTDISVISGPANQETVLRKAYYFPLSSAALLWTRAAAQRFIAQYSAVLFPYDIAVREFSLALNCGYGLSHSLMPPAQGPSEIDKVALRPKLSSFGVSALRAQKLRTGQRLRAVRNKLSDQWSGK